MKDEVGKLVEGDLAVEEAEEVDEGFVGGAFQPFGMFGHEEAGVGAGAAVFVEDDGVFGQAAGTAAVSFAEVDADEGEGERVALAEVAEPPEVGL